MSINPLKDTLWKVAFGKELTFLEKKKGAKVPEPPFANTAAGHLITTNYEQIFFGKVCIVVGAIFLTLGITMVLVYTYADSFAASAMAEPSIELGTVSAVIGGAAMVGGIILWIWCNRRIEQAQNKPLVEMIDRLSKELMQVRRREFSTLHEEKEMCDDATKILSALELYRKKS